METTNETKSEELKTPVEPIEEQKINSNKDEIVHLRYHTFGTIDGL